MLGVIDFSTYLVGLILIILLPGPNSLYVISVSARRGIRQGYRAAAGVFAGDTVLMVLSAAGVASLLKANDLLFGVVRWAGAAYLAYLALGMLRGGWRLWQQHRQNAVPIEAPVEVSALAEVKERPFRRAVVVSLLNPKAILFFVAFFVQFVDPAYAYPWLSFLVLGAFAQLGSVLYLSALIFGGTRLADSFRRRRRLSAVVSASIGAAFLIFAAKLSFAG